MTRLAATLLLLATSLLCAIPVAALPQTRTGVIRGGVTAPDGSPLPGVVVTLSGPGLIVPQERTTDQEGRYVFVALPPGDYRAEFRADGFEPLARENLQVSIGQTVSLDVSLEAAGVTEEIAVEGGSPIVDTSDANLGTVFSESSLQQVPSGRDLWSLLEHRAPGVVMNRYDVGGGEAGFQGSFSARGTSNRQNQYILNGVNATDPLAAGLSMFYYNYDSLEEVQVSTSAHGPEIQTPGVILQMVTKSGGNDFHGSGQYYYQGEALQSGNIDDDLRVQGITAGPKIDYISDGSVQLGGPILRDRAWFFGSYRDWRIFRFVPNFPEVQSTEIPLFSLRGTVQIDAANQISGFWTRHPYDRVNTVANRFIAPEAANTEDDVFGVAQGEWQSVLSDAAFLEARVSYADEKVFWKFQPDITGQSATELTTNVVSGAAGVSFSTRQERFTVKSKLFYFTSGSTGEHYVDAGFEYQRSPTHLELLAVGDVQLITLGGAPLLAVRLNTPVQGDVIQQGVGLFFRDDWTLGDRLTLDLGIRWDGTNFSLPEQESPAGTFALARRFPEMSDVVEWSRVVPRLGLIFDAFGDGRTAAKASFSLYSHQLGNLTVNAGGNPNGLIAEIVPWNDANGDGQFQPGEGGPVLFTQGGSIGIDPELQSPLTREITVGVEHELMEDWLLGATFIHRHADDLVEDVEIALDAGDFVPVTIVDPGPDNTPDTTDDGTLTVFNQVNRLGENQVRLANAKEKEVEYTGLELTLRKRFSNRWQLDASLTLGRAEALLGKGQVPVAIPGFDADPGVPSSDLFDSPNGQINARGSLLWDRPYSLKVSGSYSLPHDVLVGGVLRSQSGQGIGRILQVPLNQGIVRVFAEPRGSTRLNAVTTVDLRAGKEFDLARGMRLGAYADVFNLLNANTVTAVSDTVPTFGAPTSVLAPRVVRLGARLTF